MSACGCVPFCAPRLLLEQWCALVSDWAVVGTQAPLVQLSYKPMLFAVPSPTVISSVAPYLQRAWTPALQALSCSVSAADGALPSA
jgi:hypothetical protein